MESCFVVRDGSGLALAFIYFATTDSQVGAMLSRDEARRVAANIAKLPDLLKR